MEPRVGKEYWGRRERRLSSPGSGRTAGVSDATEGNRGKQDVLITLGVGTRQKRPDGKMALYPHHCTGSGTESQLGPPLGPPPGPPPPRSALRAQVASSTGPAGFSPPRPTSARPLHSGPTSCGTSANAQYCSGGRDKHTSWETDFTGMHAGRVLPPGND